LLVPASHYDLAVLKTLEGVPQVKKAKFSRNFKVLGQMVRVGYGTRGGALPAEVEGFIGSTLMSFLFLHEAPLWICYSGRTVPIPLPYTHRGFRLPCHIVG
jgi:hypothetical protein